MKGRAIRTRILAAFTLAVVSMMATLGYGIHRMQAIGHELEAVNRGLLPLSRASVELRALVSQLDRDHDRFARPGSAPDAARKANASLYRSSIRDALVRGVAAADQAQALARQVEDTEALAKLRTVFTEMEQQSETYADAVATWFDVNEAGDEATSSRILADLDRRRQGLAAGADLAQGLVEGQVERVSQRAARAQRDALFISIALAVLSLVLSAALAGLALLALRPIAELIEQVQRVAAGDLSGRIALNSKDEMGVLAEEFNAMAQAVYDRDQALLDRAATLEQLQASLRRVLDTITSGLVVIENDQIAVLNPAATVLWGVGVSQQAPEWMLSLGDTQAEVSVGGAIYAVSAVAYGQDGRLVVGEDITEREAVRERLKRSERLAIVGRMLAQITHEVRNPLNAMSLNAEMLADEVHSEDARAMLDTISGEIRRLESLTERYLHLSRKRVSELEHTDPRIVVEGLLALDAMALSQAGLEVSVDAATPGQCEFDVDAVTRALRNLLRNAAEAGASHAQIDAEREGQWLTFCVTDDGPGLDEDQQNQVFDPFFTTKARGTGLGLAVSRQEVEEIGGSLHHDSTHAEGARFILRIPIQG